MFLVHPCSFRTVRIQSWGTIPGRPRPEARKLRLRGLGSSGEFRSAPRRATELHGADFEGLGMHEHRQSRVTTELKELVVQAPNAPQLKRRPRTVHPR